MPYCRGCRERHLPVSERVEIRLASRGGGSEASLACAQGCRPFSAARGAVYQTGRQRNFADPPGGLGASTEATSWQHRQCLLALRQQQSTAVPGDLLRENPAVDGTQGTSDCGSKAADTPAITFRAREWLLSGTYTTPDLSTGVLLFLTRSPPRQGCIRPLSGTKTAG